MTRFPVFDATLLLQLLEDWQQSGRLRALDLALARFIRQQTATDDPLLLLSVALVSEAAGQGHVCLDLHTSLQQRQQLQQRLQPANTAQQQRQQCFVQWLQGLTLEAWLSSLSLSPAISDCRAAGDAWPERPLVLSGSNHSPLLYLRRYHQHEQQIQQGILQRLQQPLALPEAATQHLLQALFPESGSARLPTDQPDWQKISCVLAARHNFGIITGGPGTGKTTTVIRLLALLQGLQLLQQQPLLQIRLAAPTGKAAARLNASISRNVSSQPLPAALEQQLRAAIPTQVTTLHRLLGSQANTRHFRHHAGHPLPADLVVVDEASMVDVEMMARLLDALPPTARLILIGDKDQLASVEAGSVLGDLCQDALAGHYTADTCDWIQRITGEAPLDPQTGRLLLDEQGSAISQATGMLRHSYRFANHPGIGQLAATVNRTQPAAATEVLQLLESRDNLGCLRPEKNHWTRSFPQPTRPLTLQQAFHHLVVEGYRGYLQQLNQRPTTGQDDPEALQHWAQAVFAAHARFQLLAAVRQGDWGVEQLNREIRKALVTAGLLPAGNQQWYAGRPVLITRNDYSLKLMNGDIGICLDLCSDASPDQPAQLWVAFADEQGGIRWILPSRLQDAETVFAMTVHKSQGSEFEHTALVLPDQPGPVLTRELLYTGITRSSKDFTLVLPNPELLTGTLQNRVERASGLQPLFSRPKPD
ncbi:exodeoxyribonuclease V subunit alpha [Marinospirillum alkaliphilum]|uniref:RecBCD enzyme subunit RecD n=1 Tax=Marinospirillum alkaliphilum DSM 21637 TaxID=1122209 RepID=A0A1K1YNU1_9GAMM|nr:exodeoxyribonuclease V subunit alpha [Marinospirillum alkaliphilum]SFX63673.1 DNA helicase/exodeoxyribonuclease V, alpha subunit [Marinospirillum alkaliphilum DSM 21637]